METRTILLIEDDQNDITLAKRALKKANIINELAVAKDGREALDRLFDTGAVARGDRVAPEVILLDLKLPKMSGLEVLKRIRENDKTKRIPVIVLTSSKEEEDVAGCYDSGANSYIRKPVNFDDFVETMRQIGLYWLVLNESPPQRSY